MAGASATAGISSFCKGRNISGGDPSVASDTNTIHRLLGEERWETHGAECVAAEACSPSWAFCLDFGSATLPKAANKGRMAQDFQLYWFSLAHRHRCPDALCRIGRAREGRGILCI